MNPSRLVVGVLVGLAIPALLAQQNESPVDWVRSRAIRLTTAEAGHGFADLQPLERVVGNARIVSLGEATHGSREFFQLKHRMLEFLATQMGFSIFSIEANMPEAYRLNDYVLNGTGDPAQLLRGMYFWTWDTEEVLTMIQWMRAFNQSGKGRVQFTGFDMQTPTVAAENVRTFVAKHEPAYLAAVAEATTAATRAAGCRRPGVRRRNRFVPDRASRREEGAVQRLHQDGRCHSRVCGSVVARRRPFGCSGVRQHADTGRDRFHGLGSVHDRASRRRQCEEHQLRRAAAG